MYSPADWTAVRQAGQVPGELLGSDGVRKRGKGGDLQVPQRFHSRTRNLQGIPYCRVTAIMQHGLTQKCQMEVFCPLTHSSNTWQLVNKPNNQKAVRLMRETWKAKFTRLEFPTVESYHRKAVVPGDLSKPFASFRAITVLLL